MYVPVKISLVETKYFPRVHGKSEVEYNWVSPVMDARIIDDKYAVLGTIKSSDGNFSPIIEYYDKHGNRLSHDIFGSDQWFWAHCFIDTRDDGIVIAGRIKSKLGGERAPAQSVIVKYSAEGNHLWNTIYTEPYQEALYTEKIIETSDDVYTCITGDYPGRGYLITLTPTSFSSSDLPNVFYDFVTTRDGGYILVGNMMHITKIDANGSIEWTKTYSGPKRDWGSSVLELLDGYIVAGGTRNTENEEADILVLRMDAEGIPLWNKTYGGAEWDTANHIVNVPDGFVITGQTHSFGDGGSDVWVLWISESGELYRSETYSKPGDIYTYESGKMIIQGFNQTAVVATASGEYGYEPWIIILD